MNVPLPAGLFSNNAYFYANNSFNLGSLVKPANARTLVSVDYSQLPNQPVVPTAQWFTVDIGTQPPLVVSTPKVSGEILTFLLSNGTPGVSYNVAVNITYGEQTRTDNISVEVPDGDGCGCSGGSIPLPGTPLTLPAAGNIAGFLTGEGVIFLNSGVRFFVSAVAPSSAVILDQWYNSTTRITSELITDGSNLIWQPLDPVVPILQGQFEREQLTIATLNTIPNLSHLPVSTPELNINGRSFYPLGGSPPFSLSGQAITWASTIYSVQPGDIVVASYVY